MHPIWGCTWAQRQLRAESPCLACLLPQITNPSAMPQSPLRSRPLGRGFFQGRARLRPQHASKQSQLGRRFQSSWAGPGQGGGKGAVPSTCACQELLAGLPTTGTLQPCPVPALSAHEHGHLWGTGSTSQNSTGIPCGAAVVVLVPPLHNWGASPGLCPLLRAETGPSSASRQPPQGFWPHDRSRGCPPPPRSTANPCPPTVPVGWGPARASPAGHRGQGLRVPRAWCRSGGRGRAARMGTQCSLAVCVPGTLP